MKSTLIGMTIFVITLIALFTASIVSNKNAVQVSNESRDSELPSISTEALSTKQTLNSAAMQALNDQKPSAQLLQSDHSKMPSLLTQFLDGSIEYITVREGELHKYLIGLWDGQLTNIEHPIYKITTKQDNLTGTEEIAITISKKTTQQVIDDFKYYGSTAAIDELVSSTEFGEDLPEKENYLRLLAENIPNGTITIESLTCKTLKCAMYIIGDSKSSFMAFAQQLSRLENHNIMVLQPGEERQGLIYLNTQE